jgi:hypothetical protein
VLRTASTAIVDVRERRCLCVWFNVKRGVSSGDAFSDMMAVKEMSRLPDLHKVIPYDRHSRLGQTRCIRKEKKENAPKRRRPHLNSSREKRERERARGPAEDCQAFSLRTPELIGCMGQEYIQKREREKSTRPSLGSWPSHGDYR